MLPMILGFLGSAFAPALAGATGIAALASPLLAGSIGTGLGTAIERRDLGAGIKAGLGSFVGGKLVGGLMGGAMGQVPDGQGVMGTGATAMTTGTPLTSAVMPPTSGGSGGLFSSGALGRGMQFAQSPTGIGALMGASMATPPPTVEMPEEAPIASTAEMKAIPRQAQFPGAEYMPGVSPEFDYGVSTPYSYNDLTAYRDRGVLPYAEGGDVKKPNEKTEIVEAITAIKGQHPQPEIALGKFVAKYGEDALRDLVDSVQSGEFDDTLGRFAAGEKGMVRGPGDGTGVDDKVPATIDGEQDVLLADGEFVLRKDATDALEKKFGGGFLSSVNDAGPKAADALEKRVAA